MKLIRNIAMLACMALITPLFCSCEKDEEQYADTVEITRVKEITYDSAVCEGYVKGVYSEKGIWYAPAETPETGTHLKSSGGIQYFVTLDGLEKGATYLVRAYAVCSGQTLYSPTKSFSTLRDGEPLLRFMLPSNITNTTATLEGYVVANGGLPVLARGFCYGVEEEPTLENGKALAVAGDIGMLKALITELEDEATYYGRIYVENASGVFYSDPEPFTTIPYNKPVPSVLTIAGLGTATMTVTARIDSDNDLEITGRGVRYSPTEEFEDGTDIAAAQNGKGEYTVTIPGLDPGQLYNVWAYATNRKGTAYSEMMTAKALVRVDKVAALGYSAVGSIEVVNLGSFESPVTEVGICWSSSPAPTIDDNHAKVADGTQLGLGTFGGMKMWGLKPNTTYYVRGYAINEFGRSYSREQSFTTREDLYDAQIRTGEEGKKLPYFQAWQIILNDALTPANANVPEAALSPAFREIYRGLESACQSYQSSYMNGVIYRLRPTTDGNVILQFTLYLRKKDASGPSKTLTSTGWNNVNLRRNADGTFRVPGYKPITSVIYTQNTAEGKAYIDVMFKYLMEHDFYFEWVASDYKFGAAIDNDSGPVRLVPVDAPEDYWTFTTKNYTATGDYGPIANPF